MLNRALPHTLLKNCGKRSRILSTISLLPTPMIYKATSR